MADTAIKPNICMDDVRVLLKDILKFPVDLIEEAASGRIKKVYFFKSDNKFYVIRFSMDNTEFNFEKYLQEIFHNKGFPLPKILYIGAFKNCFYAISEKIVGVPISSLNEIELKIVLPNIIEAITKLHSIDISTTVGYGWLDKNMNGPYKTLEEFLQAFFSREIDGFWKDWYELFEKSFLNHNIFSVLYEKMLSFAPYSEGYRNLVHTDFHHSNILINNTRISGIIDWGGVSYLDFVFDIAKLALEFPGQNILESFQEFYDSHEIEVPFINERFLCAAICCSLDGMRFWAKLGNQEVYSSILENILNLLQKYDVKI